MHSEFNDQKHNNTKVHKPGTFSAPSFSLVLSVNALSNKITH